MSNLDSYTQSDLEVLIEQRDYAQELINDDEFETQSDFDFAISQLADYEKEIAAEIKWG